MNRTIRSKARSQVFKFYISTISNYFVCSGKGHVKGGVLPAYCDPPNPCPKGYTSEDGCIEVDEFENKAEFSRKYQVCKHNIY